jgi:hypothetical protein
MKSLVDLLEVLLREAGAKCNAEVTLDVRTLRSRVEHEGDSFITIALPSYCSDFERSLADGRISSTAFPAFKRGGSGKPLFLQGMLDMVFDAEGSLLESPRTDVIRLVRQVTLFGKKLERPCSDARLARAIRGFVQCDDEVAPVLKGQLGRWFQAVARVLLRDWDLTGVSIFRNIRPHHGPGSTRDERPGNRKWQFRRWHQRLEEVGFTYFRFASATSWRYWWSKEADAPTLVEPWDEDPVKVVFVPKTLKSPRVIAIEPACMQYAQQGLLGLVLGEVAKSPLMAGHVNFDDQTINQDCARRGSLDGTHATLDLSEASDRVSLAHVEGLLASKPDLLEWVLACRSSRAQLPDGRIVSLKKFASMGSALCFPMESMVFYTSIIASRLLRMGRFPTHDLVRSLAQDVYVFGDDLIVPADEALTICEDLEALGLKVNARKSFWTGKFRESCGEDCYDGERVTPVYLHHDIPKDRSDDSVLLSVVATVNQLFAAGFVETATALRQVVEKILGLLPQVSPQSPAIGWHFPSKAVPDVRWNAHLQRREYRCWTARSPRCRDPLTGYAAMAKCFLVMERRPRPNFNKLVTLAPPRDEEHLETSPTRYAVALKRSWVPGSRIQGCLQSNLQQGEEWEQDPTRFVRELGRRD